MGPSHMKVLERVQRDLMSQMERENLIGMTLNLGLRYKLQKYKWETFLKDLKVEADEAQHR